MEPSGVWSVDDPDRFAPFQQVTNTLRLPVGKEVPGRVLLRGRPHWVADLNAQRNDPTFPRAPVAASVGLRAGMAFPILSGDAVSGALEFYAAEVVQPDESLLEILAQVDQQLGRVIERERAAQELRASEARFRSVAQSAADAIVVADATGNVTFWNRAAEHLFGHTDDEIAGRPLSLLLPERLRQPHEADLQRLASGGSAHVTGRTQELTGLHHNGREFPIELAFSTWESQGRRFFSGMIRDLSARKSAEEAARAQEERLRRATRLDAIGSLAGGIAHDFNNILTVIFGHADLLADDTSRPSTSTNSSTRWSRCMLR